MAKGAGEYGLYDITYNVSGSTITKYAAVVIGGGTEDCALPSAAGEQCIGIAQHEAKDGKAIRIRAAGTSKAIWSGASKCTRGTRLAIADTAGRVKAWASGDKFIGFADSDSGGTGADTGDEIYVRLNLEP